MSQINNQTLLKELRDEAKILNIEPVPQQLAEKIVPVIITKQPKKLVSAYVTGTNSVQTTILTTSSIKRTFVVSAALSMEKDVTATSSISWIQAFEGGDYYTQSVAVWCPIQGITLTASKGQQSMFFGNDGIELKKGSIVSVNHSAAVGNVAGSGCIVYYEVD